MADFVFLLIGSIFGSFCTVVGYRIPLKQSIASPRSHCSICGKTLRAIDLIPVFSYFYRKGKCHYCGSNISSIHLWIEILSALTFYYSLNQFYYPPILLLVFFIFAFILSVSDYFYFVLPNLLVFLFFFCLSLIKFSLSFGNSLTDFYHAFVLLVICSVLLHIFPDSIGGGDIKLLVLLTWIFGISISLFSLFIASFTGLLYIILNSLRKNGNWHDPIPFAPFIFLGYSFVFIITSFSSFSL